MARNTILGGPLVGLAAIGLTAAVLRRSGLEPSRIHAIREAIALSKLARLNPAALKHKRILPSKLKPSALNTSWLKPSALKSAGAHLTRTAEDADETENAEPTAETGHADAAVQAETDRAKGTECRGAGRRGTLRPSMGRRSTARGDPGGPDTGGKDRTSGESENGGTESGGTGRGHTGHGDAERADTERAGRIRQQFKANGAHSELQRVIQLVMHAPDSYAHRESHWRDEGDHIVVRTTFDGDDSSGNRVTNWVEAEVDSDGQIQSVLGHGTL
jgi:hypothetical protein